MDSSTGQHPALDSVEIWATTKLASAGDWSGPSLASQITKERLQGLLRVFQRGKLDNMVKVRILIVCLFLPRAELADFKPELMQLAEQARHDDDEWVRVMGEAVGTFDGQLDLQKVCESSSLVRDTVTGLQAGLHLAKPLPGFMPLQEPLMHPGMRIWRNGNRRAAHGHFAGPRRDPSCSAEDEGASGRHTLDALLPGLNLWSMDIRGGGAPRGTASAAHTSIYARRGTQAEGATMFRPSAPPLAPTLAARPAPAPLNNPPAIPCTSVPQQPQPQGSTDFGGEGVVGNGDVGVGGALPRGKGGGMSTGTALLAAHRQVRTQPLQLQEARAASQAAVQAQAQVHSVPGRARGRPRKQPLAQPSAGPTEAEPEDDRGTPSARRGSSREQEGSLVEQHEEDGQGGEEQHMEDGQGGKEEHKEDGEGKEEQDGNGGQGGKEEHKEDGEGGEEQDGKEGRGQDAQRAEEGQMGEHGSHGKLEGPLELNGQELEGHLEGSLPGPGWEGGAEPSCMHERAFKRPRIQMDGIGESDIEEI